MQNGVMERNGIVMKRTTGASQNSKGFTLVELLVVVAIIALLVSILLPALGRAKEQVKLTLCTSNVRSIGVAWRMYAGENNAFPPMLSGSKTAGAYADALRMGETCTETDLGTGAQQNLCLLVNNGAAPWGIFLCPSTRHKEADRSHAGKKFGLGEGSTIYCDYAVQILDRDAGNLCSPKQMDSGIAIVGDQPPRYRVSNFNLMEKWSQNHPEYGESLLYAGGGAKFSKDMSADTDGRGRNRNTGGWGGNNVYTQDAWYDGDSREPALNYNRRLVGVPKSTKDSVLFAYGQSDD